MNKTLFHCHSDNSLKDATMTVETLVKTAKDKGYNSVTLTDHGNCIGLFEFMKSCKKHGINGIPGVEGYMEIPLTDKLGHIILVAKNYKGYCKIAELVSIGHNNQKDVGTIKQPVFTIEQVDEICRNSSDVICTSACVGGFLALMLNSNQQYEKEINRQKKKKEKYLKSIDFDEKEKLIKELENIENDIENLRIEQQTTKKIASKKYNFRKKKVSKIEDEKTKKIEEQKLAEDIEETKQAEILYEEKKKELAAKRRERTKINKEIRKITDTEAKIQKAEEEIEECVRLFLPKNVLIEETEKVLLRFKDIFKENFYIELQYKRIPDEKKIMPILLDLAKKHEVKTVIGNDAHIANKSDIRAREIMSTLRFSHWIGREDYWEYLAILTEEELTSLLEEILPKKDVALALENTREIGEMCKVEFPKITHYPVFTKDRDAKELLREKAYLGIDKKFKPNEFTEEYKERLEHELNIICDLGYADYLLIVADFIEYAREYAKSIDQSGLGYGVGPGRGSGAGCLVNYLLGITNIDPLKYGLIFERFLNKDRVSMPDIDTDFSDEVRNPTIEYVKKKYGKESVASIRTTLKYAAKSSIRNVARVIAYEKSNDSEEFEKLVKEYRKVADKMCKVEGFDGSIKDNENLLKSKFGNDKLAMEILDNAKMIEGLSYGNGLHAAGIIIGDGQPLKEYVPLMYNDSKKQWAVQCDMVESEMDLGLLKMDFLGLKNLKIITDTIRMVYKNYGVSIDPEKIPFDSKVFKEIFSKGNTVSVFQFESFGMRKMLKEYRPENFDDVILPIAAYRPGPMEFIPEIIAVKNGKKKAEYCIPELEPILSNTYGKPIFQEQIMDIFHKCAGFTLGEADIIRRHMSKKHVEEFLSYKPQFINGFIEKGAKREDAEKFWDELVGFAEYAFNKSHAAVYSLVSYQTAYLKYYYPAEFMCAILNSENDFSKIAKSIAECRNLGIKVFAPKINNAFVHFTATKKGIMYGFESIKGFNVKNAETIINERKENGPYKSLQNFVYRTGLSEKVTESLICAGSFDDFIKFSNRGELLKLIPEIYETAEELKKTIDKLNKSKETIELLSNKDNLTKKQSKDLNSAEIYVESHKEIIEKLLKKMEQFSPERVEKDPEKELIFLKSEKELLGAFVSAHPLESYEYLYKDIRYTKIENITEDVDNTFYIGIINNLKFVRGRRTGKEMAFFELEDTTSSTKICVYDNVDDYKDILIEGKIIAVKGLAQYNKFKVEFLKEQQELEGKNEIIEFAPENVEIVAHEIKNISKQLIPGMLFIKSTESVYDFYKKYHENEWQDDSGREVILIDQRQESSCTTRVCNDIFMKEDLLELHGNGWHYQLMKDNLYPPVDFD